MKYWLFNAEQADGLQCDAADIWFEDNMGFSGDDRNKYGKPLGKLKVGNVVLMYQNQKGIVGIGTVAKPWDGKGYKRKRIYVTETFPEYRIQIDWKYDLRETPFKLGWAPRKFLCSVQKAELVSRIEEAMRLAKMGHVIRPTAEEADEYIPSNRDEREVIRQQVKARRGQQGFRNRLVKRYGPQCQITGCTIFDIVEAAHIRPYRGAKDNHPDNGVLLRADMHTLFDLDMIGIHPKSLAIYCTEAVRETYAGQISDKLVCGKTGRPSETALDERFKRFDEMKSS